MTEAILRSHDGCSFKLLIWPPSIVSLTLSARSRPVAVDCRLGSCFLFRCVVDLHSIVFCFSLGGILGRCCNSDHLVVSRYGRCVFSICCNECCDAFLLRLLGLVDLVCLRSRNDVAEEFQVVIAGYCIRCCISDPEL